MKRILVVAAHPDDDILGCGATISKAIQEGCACRIIFLAEGTSARYDLGEFDSKKVSDEIEHRTEYCKNALNVIGCTEYKFYNLPCGRLDCQPLIDIGKIIEKEIKSFHPDTIFTHSNVDTNNDHRTVFQAVLQATRPGALNRVSRLYSFEVLTSTEWRFVEAFSPNYFVSITKEQLETKINALNEYKSEIKDYPYPRSSQGLTALASIRGMQAGTEYAEAFVLFREIV